jgi:hypothetical protein
MYAFENARDGNMQNPMRTRIASQVTPVYPGRRLGSRVYAINFCVFICLMKIYGYSVLFTASEAGSWGSKQS